MEDNGLLLDFFEGILGLGLFLNTGIGILLGLGGENILFGCLRKEGRKGINTDMEKDQLWRNLKRSRNELRSP